MRKHLLAWTMLAATAIAVPLATRARAEDKDAAMLAKGMQWVLKAQNANGSWGEVPGEKEKGEIGFTALAITALVHCDEAECKGCKDAADKAAGWLVSTQKENGCFTQGKLFSTYRTSLSIIALHQLDAAKYKAPIDKAVAWLKHDQFSEDSAEKVGPDSPHYGGFGYDDHTGDKPDADLSNTHFALAALKEAGVPQDDPVWKRAMEFVTRSQNDPETNKGIKGVLKPKNDGGFFYGPSRSQSADEKNDDGSKSYESYASMTYAGLVSFIYAGVSKDDARVKAALGWIKEHYTLEENYGMGIRRDPKLAQQGLFYYYLAFAKALSAYGEKEIDTNKGKRSWARDLLDVLASKQKPDGSWINENSERWMEKNPLLATLYSVNAIEMALKHK